MKFQGVQFLRIDDLESFRGLIVEVAQDLRHTHIDRLKKIMGLFFADTPRSAKTVKSNTLENFPLYSNHYYHYSSD